MLKIDIPNQLAKSDGPDAKSLDHLAMAPFWHKVTTIIGGATTMRAAHREFLPKHPDEDDRNYQVRVQYAKFTNVYRDIVENLSQRPFAKEVTITEDSPESVHDFVKDVDGRGSTLHTFGGDVFFDGINYAVDWILVDYTANVPANATRAMERQIGARPYWVRYRASDVLAAQSAMVNGREQFVHVRLRETVTRREGWSEVKVERIRVFDREETPDPAGGPSAWGVPTWQVWEKRKDVRTQLEKYVALGDPRPLPIDEIPLVPFMTGRRKSGTWQFYPPMQDAADLQIDLFQQESGLKHASQMTAFPMLSASGVRPETGEDGTPVKIGVGPHMVLYAPHPGGGGSPGEWKFIEPNAQSLRFLADEIRDTIKELRELGRQPLTAQSGNLTVVTTAFAAQKGNSAIQAWALNLKFALEQCLRLTGLWIREDWTEVDVQIDTDFDLGFGDDASFKEVREMRKQGDISREAEIAEAKRRGILSADYDAEEDLELIDRDMEEDGDESPSGAGAVPPADGAGTPPPAGGNPEGDDEEGDDE